MIYVLWQVRHVKKKWRKKAAALRETFAQLSDKNASDLAGKIDTTTC
jgi:hypothetical protein